MVIRFAVAMGLALFSFSARAEHAVTATSSVSAPNQNFHAQHKIIAVSEDFDAVKTQYDSTTSLIPLIRELDQPGRKNATSVATCYSKSDPRFARAANVYWFNDLDEKGGSRLGLHVQLLPDFTGQNAIMYRKAAYGAASILSSKNPDRDLFEKAREFYNTLQEGHAKAERDAEYARNAGSEELKTARAQVYQRTGSETKLYRRYEVRKVRLDSGEEITVIKMEADEVRLVPNLRTGRLDRVVERQTYYCK